MINAARTYLINAGASGRYTLGNFGEEYIPASYRPIVDVEALKLVRGVLFGNTPDIFTQNYRAAQYMNILHGSDLGLQYLLELDKRYTYDPLNSVYEVSTDPVVIALDAPAQSGKISFSQFRGRDDDGLNAARFKVSAVAATNFDVTIEDQWWRRVTTTVNVTGVANGSGFKLDPFILPGTDTQITISSTTNLVSPASWIVELYSRPSRSIDDILNKLIAVQGGVTSLCYGGKFEPYTTFFNMFLRHHRSNDRLAGVLLALIHRTKELADAQ